MPGGEIFGLPSVLVYIVAALLAILWFFLPVAIYGIQPKLDKILMEIRHTNALLNRIASNSEAPDAEPRDDPPPREAPPDDRLSGP